MLTFRAAFLVCVNPGRTGIGGLGIQQTKKYPAGSEPAGLYKINQGGFAGLPPPRGRCTTTLNKYEKEILRQQGEILSLFLHILLLFLLCVAVRVVSCCLCNGAVVSYGGKCTAPLHMRLFQPHIYNMTNLSKNKNHFF